jgi:type 1 glutamine amidotransferase
MQRRDFLRLSGALAAGSLPLVAGRSTAAPPASIGSSAKRRILFFTKSASFQHSSIARKGDELSHGERVLTELGKQHGFDVVATKDGTIFDGDLSQFDAFFFYTTGDLTQKGTDGQPPMSAEGKRKLIEAVAAGKGFLASHCGSDTFHGKGDRRSEQPAAERDPYIRMLGGEFISHGPQQKARQVVCSPQFPGLSGAGESFEMNEEWYSLKNFADDLHVILLQDTQGMQGEDYERPAFPSTWARRHEKGRVFYTSMGHREDVWTNPVFQQILLGGIRWACGDAEFALTQNLTEKTPGARVMPPPKKDKPKPAAKPATKEAAPAKAPK